MVEYVRGSDSDNWHWCKNCTQYPMYVRQRRFDKPHSKLCPQCQAKEDNKDCATGDMTDEEERPRIENVISPK